MKGGRTGVYRQERVAKTQGFLRVEALGEEWSVSFLDKDGESIRTGVMGAPEGHVVMSNGLKTKCFYGPDGQLKAVKIGILSLTNHLARGNMDPDLVNTADWDRLASLYGAKEEIMFVLFLGDEEFPPYWCLQRVDVGLDRGPVLEMEMVDSILMRPKIRTAEPLFYRSLGDFDMKFCLMVDGYEVSFGIVDEKKMVVHAHAIRREVDFADLGDRARSGRGAKAEDLDGVLRRVSPGLKLLP